MPTVKININTGIEYSPTDGLDSSVKLHNFTVGSDGSLYKLPVLKNLKNAKHKVIDQFTVWPFRILDFKKFQTSTLDIPPDIPVATDLWNFHASSLFRRFVYLTGASYGVINIDYDGKRILNTDLPSEQDKFGEFEKTVFNYVPDNPGEMLDVDLSSLRSQIIVDFNSQFNGLGEPTQELRCVFPMQYMFISKEESGYNLLINPRNVINCSMDATSLDPDIKALSVKDVADSERTKNDLARGCISIGNRMFFYSAFDGRIYVSASNDFTQLMKAESGSLPFSVNPTEEIQSLTDFNGNIISFTPTGIDRWVLSNEDKTILQRDPTFHFDHRVRYGGSYVKANRDLYYYTDDFHVYRLNANLTVDNIFTGILPTYKPLDDYLIRDETLPTAYFKMLGYRFVSVGPWLYNIDTSTWSTYSFDGWKRPYFPNYPSWVWESNTSKQVIAAAQDDIICTYNTFCKQLTYKEMQELPDGLEPTLFENAYQWGEVAFFTTRMVQDERTFSLDGIEVYVEGGVLSPGSKMWLQVLRGGQDGDFDQDDESTYGVPAYYEPVSGPAIGEPEDAHVGKFIWRTNIKTDRFRLQIITKEMRGIVVQSVLANITSIGDSQKFINKDQETQKPEKETRQ